MTTTTTYPLPDRIEQIRALCEQIRALMAEGDGWTPSAICVTRHSVSMQGDGFAPSVGGEPRPVHYGSAGEAFHTERLGDLYLTGVIAREVAR